MLQRITTKNDVIDTEANPIEPCPFCGCGSVDMLPLNDNQATAIYCTECPAGVEDAGKTLNELLIIWNTRK